MNTYSSSHLAGTGGGGGGNIFGQINIPEPLKNFAGGSVSAGAIGVFLNLILRILIVAAGIYALINLVLAGYAFMAAGDDPKKAAGAWAKIWRTLIGLAFVAGAFVLAAIFGWLIFGDPNAILSPSLPTP